MMCLLLKEFFFKNKRQLCSNYNLPIQYAIGYNCYANLLETWCTEVDLKTKEKKKTITV